MADMDPIMGPKEAFEKDISPLKINLGIGSYVDGEGKPYVFKIVQKVKEIILQQNNHHVLPLYMKGISVQRWTEIVYRRGENFGLRKELFFYS